MDHKVLNILFQSILSSFFFGKKMPCFPEYYENKFNVSSRTVFEHFEITRRNITWKTKVHLRVIAVVKSDSLISYGNYPSQGSRGK